MAAVAEAPEMTVVVCTNRRPSRLQKTLEALSRQSIRELLEIVVVDDGAPAPLGPTCHHYGARLFTHKANCGLAAARNTGWRAARGPVVAFTDDDCRPREHWAEVLLAAYEDPCVVAAGGEVVPCGARGLLGRYYTLKPPIAPLEAELGESSSPAHRLRLYLAANLTWTKREGRREVFSLPGASMSVRRSALERVGGFDPGIRFGGEDEDFFYRLRLAKPHSKLVFDPGAVTEHDFGGGPGDMLRRARAYGRGCARNFVKHPAWGPTLFPVPVAVAVLFAAAAKKGRWLGVAAMLAPVAFARWPAEALRRGEPSLVLLAWLQLLEEAAADVGFVGGYLRARLELRVARP